MNKLSKGFTLIELLIVIAVVGVLAGAVWTALDPQDKISAANDAKAQSDVGAISQAQEAYATAHNGFYANGQTDLASSGDLKVALTPPTTSYTYTVVEVPADCTSGTTCINFQACTNLKSKKYTATQNWVYNSVTGKAQSQASCP